MGRNSALKARLRVRGVLEHLWDSFSRPVPHSRRELLSLLLMCLLIAVVTAGLLFGWLSGGALHYPARWAGVAACVCGVCVFLLTVLLHPLRCVLAVILPTVGSSQGQRLLLSTCVLLTLLNAPPNMANNVSTLTNTLKCTSESVVDSLLNSSNMMNTVKENLVATAAAYKAMASYVQSLRSFDHVTHVNVSMVTQRFRGAAGRLKEDFQQAQGQLGSLRLYSHRLLAAILVLHLVWGAGRYLHSYMTALDFDNVYVTPKLRQLASERGLTLTAGQLRNGVDATGYRLSRQELWECVPPLVIVTLHLLLCVVLVALDFLVYRLVSAGRPWLLDIPDTNITLNVHYKVRVCVLAGCLLIQDCCSDDLVFQRVYRWPVHMGSDVCQTTATASAPDGGVLVLLVLLFLLSYALAVMQVYVRRVRRAVAASFYPRQEERRNHFLLRKLLAKQRGGVFTIATAERVSSGTERTLRQQTNVHQDVRQQLPER
ncbi:osteoclast stimulatory transmembrane protein isoform X1 [Alosa sapidissima]|uniref:osteoclast stimulatory transmembrane protein isoform X1 n=1 Tax=Alosa sapidissima TaxID=34773 RepID=UPI001C0A5EF8|nr:osteoclast stimulatory transmembrane protein isoform X1 [Alosa sapidissima]